MGRRRSIVGWLSALALLAAGAAAEAGDLGSVRFPNSGAPAAQEAFLRGVAALHSFWYDEAADAFREARRLDPGFALAYWGEAMTHNHPLWSEQDQETARKVLGELGATPGERAARDGTAREKGYLQAVEALYGEGEKAARDRAYEEAMARLARDFPEDDEAAAFRALAILGTVRPGEPTEERVRKQVRSAAILEELFDRHSDHPGVLHYMIHAYDDPVHAPLGLRAARLYSRVAPAAHHALHMPSHIFLQLGRWPETAASNEAAWAASVKWVERRKLASDKRDFHSLSWLAYTYLQQGRRAEAEQVLGIAREAARENDSPRIAGTLAGMEARHALETGRSPAAPAAASGAPAAPGAAATHCAAPVAAYGTRGPENATLLAAGLAAARAGDAATAERMAARLAEEAGKAEGYAAKPQRIMEKEVAGMALLARGKKEEALAALAEAAALEAGTDPPSGPPEPVKPAAELYGEVLLELSRPREAAEQLERSLLRTPNRAASLLGAARAAAALGDRETARERYATLAEIWQRADAGLPEVEEARAFLAGSEAATAPAARAPR